MGSSMKDGYRLMPNPNGYNKVTCSAYGCDMRSGTNALSEIKMYPFPKEYYRRRRWELATRRANWKATYKSRLCSKHFITGKPSKDPKHPDYVPSIFVFTENVQSLKKSLKELQKKMNSSVAKSHENSSDLDNDSSHEETCVASSCGKSFCSKCFSPESVSSAFNMSLAPLNQTLSQLTEKLREMEEEREILRLELASCREEIHQLREAHQHCEKKSRSTRKRSKQKNLISVPSSNVAEDANEILESMYSVEPSDIDDPNAFLLLNMEQNYLQPSDKPNTGKRKRKSSDEVIGILEQCPSSKKAGVKSSNLNSVVTNDSQNEGTSSDSGSPITIVYLNR